MSYHLLGLTLFPNFQFLEQSLDIKFTANYILLRHQIETLSFLLEMLNDNAWNTSNSHKRSVVLACIEIFAVSYQLFYILYYKPTFITGYHKVESIFNVLILLPIVALLISLLSKNDYISMGFMITMTLAVMVVSLVFWKKREGAINLLKESKDKK